MGSMGINAIDQPDLVEKQPHMFIHEVAWRFT